MNSKVILLSLAVVAVGLFALPSTMSLFAGQHTWVDLDEFKCQKCHQDIYDELTTKSAYHGGFETSYGNACARCHYTTPNGNKTGANLTAQQWQKKNSNGTTGYSNDTNGYYQAVNFTAHSAITVECLACHGTSNRTFNATSQKWSNNPAIGLQSDTEAHKVFYYASVSNKSVGDVNYSSLLDKNILASGVPLWYDTSMPNQTVVQLKGTNAACIGCHTHAVVNITWNRAIGYEMNANVTNTGWDVDFTGVSSTTQTNVTSGDGT
ncbi:MAG: hypothetical protein O8C63_05310 [Candidatus Methanoperedens sp.]|nr:hypothetical protein [Candidatus Methanoperedens sp.]